MKRLSVRDLAIGGLIAALYCALTLALAPVSFGLVQLRASEALTLLPVLMPAAIPGLTVGCILSNAFGFLMGVNIAGPLDILFGSAATLIAAVASYLLRKHTVKGVPVLSALPPVILNGLFVGLELTLVLEGGFSWPIFTINALQVASGELIACFALGLPLTMLLKKFIKK